MRGVLFAPKEDIIMAKRIKKRREMHIMDLIKIGKYIAGKRKSLVMTQKQLAEKLGMSDNSEVRNKYY